MADNATGEKTEEPTPKRKEEAREEGNVAKSRELSQAFTLLAGFFILYFSFPHILNKLLERMYINLAHNKFYLLTANGAFEIIMDNIFFALKLVLPVILATAVMGLIINFIQVGPLFTGKSIVPKFSNIDPIKGAKKIFSLKTLVELIKSLAKAAVITLIAYTYLKNNISRLSSLTEEGIKPSLIFLGHLIFRIAAAIILFLVVLGIADYIFQRWEYKKNLKMTKYEVKQERKEREGDPIYKQKRLERQRAISLNRMMTDMQEADVVITNPTHVAVALKYDLEEMNAPLLLAKGEGYIALKIKEKAKEYKIEIVENKILARSLNAGVEIGEEIPSEFYQAVAEILAYVFKQDNKL